jgi:hypothetical protein
MVGSIDLLLPESGSNKRKRSGADFLDLKRRDGHGIVMISHSYV